MNPGKRTKAIQAARPLRSVPAQRLGSLTLRELPLPAGRFGVSWVHEKLPPRSRTPLIYHAATEEVFFVLKGRAVVHLDGRRVTVGPGDTLHIPAHAVHGVSCAARGVEALSLFSPAVNPDRPDVHLAESQMKKRTPANE